MKKDKPKKKKDFKDRIMDTKWERLEKEGLSRPKSAEENTRRLKESRG